MYEASREFAVSALDHYKASEWMFFSLHAGTALELLAKAYLASLHPSLVVEGVESLLYASNVPGHGFMPLGAIRTIRTTEAVNRAGRVMPTIMNLTRGELSVLIEVRNGAAHLGRIDEATARRVLIPFLHACDELLRGLSEDRNDFWSPETDFVDQRLAESAETARERVATRMAEAKHAYKERTKAYDKTTLQAFIDSITATYDLNGYERQLTSCPACGNSALLIGSIDFEWTVPGGSMDYEDWAGAAYPEVTFYPADLRCHLCGLSLNGSDELSAVELESEWLIPQEEVEPSDFALDYDDIDY